VCHVLSLPVCLSSIVTEICLCHACACQDTSANVVPLPSAWCSLGWGGLHIRPPRGLSLAAVVIRRWRRWRGRARCRWVTDEAMITAG
jgi:hypothetical protein